MLAGFVCSVFVSWNVLGFVCADWGCGFGFVRSERGLVDCLLGFVCANQSLRLQAVVGFVRSGTLARLRVAVGFVCSEALVLLRAVLGFVRSVFVCLAF